MAFGLGTLRLPPAAFWSMTPRELAAAIRGAGGGIASGIPDRGAIAALMLRFPD